MQCRSYHPKVGRGDRPVPGHLPRAHIHCEQVGSMEFCGVPVISYHIGCHLAAIFRDYANKTGCVSLWVHAPRVLCCNDWFS